MKFPLMPKATAVWLINNTTLTFEQIATFCGMHILEVQGIADGEVATGIIGHNPIMNSQLTHEEIQRCEKDQKAALQLVNNFASQAQQKKKSARYTPIARRQDKPDAIFWLLRNCPNINDSQIIKLIGTTHNTITAIRSKLHWNMQNIRPKDPVLLGLCTQTSLDQLINSLTKQANHAEVNSAEITKHSKN